MSRLPASHAQDRKHFCACSAAPATIFLVRHVMTCGKPNPRQYPHQSQRHGDTMGVPTEIGKHLVWPAERWLRIDDPFDAASTREMAGVSYPRLQAGDGLPKFDDLVARKNNRQLARLARIRNMLRDRILAERYAIEEPECADDLVRSGPGYASAWHQSSIGMPRAISIPLAAAWERSSVSSSAGASIIASSDNG